jgi:hypothetical protein
VNPSKAAPAPEEDEVKPEEVVPAPEPASEEEPDKPDFWLSINPPKAEHHSPNAEDEPVPPPEPTATPTMLLVSDPPSAAPSAATDNMTARALLTGSYDMGDDYETCSSGDYSGGGGKIRINVRVFWKTTAAFKRFWLLLGTNPGLSDPCPLLSYLLGRRLLHGHRW